MKKKQLIIIGSILFFLFITYTYFVAREYLVQFDFNTTVRTHDNIPTKIDPFFSWFSLIGSFEITSLIVAVSVFIVSIKKWRRLGIMLFFALFQGIELLFKSIIDQVGPPFMFHRYALDYHFPSTYVSSDYYSYPSGHVGRTALLVSLFAYIVWKSKLGKTVKLGILGCLAVFFVIMAVSRVSLGEHWVSDTIGGALLGFSMTAFSLILW
jgi:undecaprenyl-diphosphatase